MIMLLSSARDVNAADDLNTVLARCNQPKETGLIRLIITRRKESEVYQC